MVSKESKKAAHADQPRSVRLPPLRSIEAFIWVGRLGSLKAASERLNITTSAVSRRVHVLEDELGAALFDRGSNGMELSNLGKTYLEMTSPALDQILEATARFHAEHDLVPIRISAGSAFENHWLTPRIGRFLAENHKVQVEFITANDPRVQVLDVDASIWFGPADAELLHADVVVRVPRFPVCHPCLVDSGSIATPADLENHVLIEVISVPDMWNSWLAHSGYPGLRTKARMVVDNLDSALHAASRGLGVAMGVKYLVEHHIERGELAITFPDVEEDRSTVYVILNPTSLNRPVVQAFRDWFIRIAREELV